jgi:hypothetical protein
VASKKLVDQVAEELYGLPPGEVAEELYGLPPGEFTRARDERAKLLRKDGEREAADAVKALRKPTVTAWALNQLAREQARDVERLLSAGERLRSAQQELLAGGDRAAFQKAAAAERELVAGLAADALPLAREQGERPGAGLEDRLAATLHAAALDDETAEQLRAGRLTREREAIGGFGALGTGGAAPAQADPAPAQADSGAASPGEPARRRGAKRGDRRTKRSAGGAKPASATAAARERQAAARTDERHARRELDAATRALDHARERADAAKAHAAEAAERAKTTAKRLAEAKQAEAAAKKAHAKAAAPLKRADTRGAGR